MVQNFHLVPLNNAKALISTLPISSLDLLASQMFKPKPTSQTWKVHNRIVRLFSMMMVKLSPSSSCAKSQQRCPVIMIASMAHLWALWAEEVLMATLRWPMVLTQSMRGIPSQRQTWQHRI